MPTAAENTSGYRHSRASALNAPIEAPQVTASIPRPPRSAWMAGTTSHRTHSWNWLSSHIRCSTEPVLAIIACPATLSTEYSLTRPSASNGAQASTRPNRSISSASPPADGRTSTGVPTAPHRTRVISLCVRSENHRCAAFISSLIEELLRARKDPRQSLPEPVPPVLPAVTVACLDITHGHPGRLERRHHGPVPDDQRLVDAATDEHAVSDAARRGAVPVHEAHHRLERCTAAVIVANIGEDEGAGLQQQRPVAARIAVGSRQGGDRAEARAHQAPAVAVPASGNSASSRGTSSAVR